MAYDRLIQVSVLYHIKNINELYFTSYTSEAEVMPVLSERIEDDLLLRYMK